MSDLMETLELMCGQNEIQEVPRSFLVDLRDEIERLQARVDELEVENEQLQEALAVSKHETGTVDNALYKYEVLWSNCKGWREFDWPEGFCRRTADLIVENAERMLAKTGRYPVTTKDTNVKALEGEGK